MIEWLEAYWNALIMMVAEMAPYLLLGFFVAGILHTFVPRSIYSRHLAPRNMKSVVKAALLGIPLPLCSCGVIPTSVSLRKEGASHGACTSFLIATPQTGVDSIAATYSLMGLPFAIVRPIAALFTAMFGGWLVNRYAKDDEQISAEAAKKGEYDHCSPLQLPQGGEKSHIAEEHCECECGCEHEHHYHSLKDKFVGA
ncbi:MAG: permease, partial [Bacteroidaceae bacterium]|nr:permease [Bacteroidaceae bacterium]